MIRKREITAGARARNAPLLLLNDDFADTTAPSSVMARAWQEQKMVEICLYSRSVEQRGDLLTGTYSRYVPKADLEALHEATVANSYWKEVS